MIRHRKAIGRDAKPKGAHGAAVRAKAPPGPGCRRRSTRNAVGTRPGQVGAGSPQTLRQTSAGTSRSHLQVGGPTHSGLVDRIRELVTNCALWHARGRLSSLRAPRSRRNPRSRKSHGSPTRRIGPSACHRARFVTNLRSAPAGRPPAAPAQPASAPSTSGKARATQPPQGAPATPQPPPARRGQPRCPSRACPEGLHPSSRVPGAARRMPRG